MREKPFVMRTSFASLIEAYLISALTVAGSSEQLIPSPYPY